MSGYRGSPKIYRAFRRQIDTPSVEVMTASPDLRGVRDGAPAQGVVIGFFQAGCAVFASLVDCIDVGGIWGKVTATLHCLLSLLAVPEWRRGARHAGGAGDYVGVS
ncbi:hypothetical protein Zmor_017461 [Zophobas morio]|uniref:Uncharacterized protein n=1 Tax=Zophobas morio TaxID=2755281 RepID=A0AA38ICL6_9CUCU|nr:hypothetical protein Zmor_017461 [Zophobas morio]